MLSFLVGHCCSVGLITFFLQLHKSRILEVPVKKSRFSGEDHAWEGQACAQSYPKTHDLIFQFPGNTYAKKIELNHEQRVLDIKKNCMINFRPKVDVCSPISRVCHVRAYDCTLMSCLQTQLAIAAIAEQSRQWSAHCR